jgi:predicted transglutaminase-like cysteine proteinase
MSGRERLRGIARFVCMALAIGWSGLPSGAVAGQPALTEVVGGFGIAAQLGGPLLESSDPAFVPSVVQPDARPVEPFGAARSDGEASPYGAKWRAIIRLIDRDGSTLARCRKEPDGCPAEAGQLLAIVEAARAKRGRARLGEINRALNLMIRFQSDVIQHGIQDAWASPLTTLSAGRGDCEDYAIAKYLTLREAGIPSSDLRLVVVRDIKRLQDHAVLTVRFEERWLVLDNRRLLLLEDREIGDYVAVMAFGPEPEPFRPRVAERGRAEALGRVLEEPGGREQVAQMRPVTPN